MAQHGKDLKDHPIESKTHLYCEFLSIIVLIIASFSLKNFAPYIIWNQAGTALFVCAETSLSSASLNL